MIPRSSVLLLGVLVAHPLPAQSDSKPLVDIDVLLAEIDRDPPVESLWKTMPIWFRQELEAEFRSRLKSPIAALAYGLVLRSTATMASATGARGKKLWKIEGIWQGLSGPLRIYIARQIASLYLTGFVIGRDSGFAVSLAPIPAIREFLDNAGIEAKQITDLARFTEGLSDRCRLLLRELSAHVLRTTESDSDRAFVLRWLSDLAEFEERYSDALALTRESIRLVRKQRADYTPNFLARKLLFAGSGEELAAEIVRLETAAQAAKKTDGDKQDLLARADWLKWSIRVRKRAEAELAKGTTVGTLAALADLRKLGYRLRIDALLSKSAHAKNSDARWHAHTGLRRLDAGDPLGAAEDLLKAGELPHRDAAYHELRCWLAFRASLAQVSKCVKQTSLTDSMRAELRKLRTAVDDLRRTPNMEDLLAVSLVLEVVDRLGVPWPREIQDVRLRLGDLKKRVMDLRTHEGISSANRRLPLLFANIFQLEEAMEEFLLRPTRFELTDQAVSSFRAQFAFDRLGRRGSDADGVFERVMRQLSGSNAHIESGLGIKAAIEAYERKSAALWEVAERHFRSSLKSDPTKPANRLGNIAVCLHQRGRKAEALRMFRRAAAVADSDREIYEYLGEFATADPDLDKIERWAAPIRERSHWSARMLRQWTTGLALRLGDETRAIANAKEQCPADLPILGIRHPVLCGRTHFQIGVDHNPFGIWVYLDGNVRLTIPPPISDDKLSELAAKSKK